MLYDVDRGVVMEPMQGKLASSQFDFGYTEKFCIPGVTSVFFSSCDSVVGTLWSSIKQIEAPYVFDWENAIVLGRMHGNRASSRARGKSHVSSRVAAGTWGIISSYGGDVHSKLELVQ